MKRIIYLMLVFTLISALFILPSFAETTAEEDIAKTDAEGENALENTLEAEGELSEDGADPSEGGVNLSQYGESGFYDRVLGLVTDGAFWAKFAAIVLGVLALIVTVRANLKKIRSAINTLLEFITGKATKEETEAAIGSAVTELKGEYEKQLLAFEEQYTDLATRNDQLTAILSLLTIQLIKNPNARTQIMSLLADTKKHTGAAVDIVEAVEAEIKAAEDAEEKVATPALDAIKASAVTETANADEEILIKLG